MTHAIETKEPKETRRGVVLYDENPFLTYDTVKSKTKRIINKRGDMMIVSGETGEVVAPVAGFWQAEEVDNAQFVKLYVHGVRAFKELTGAGTKVFELLYLEIQKNISKDRVYLSYTGIDKHATDISRSTFARGLAELIDKGFVAPSPAIGWYWLNPDYMWNGDRLAFVKEYRRVSAEKKQKQIPGQLEMNLAGEQQAQDASEVSE